MAAHLISGKHSNIVFAGTDENGRPIFRTVDQIDRHPAQVVVMKQSQQSEHRRFEHWPEH